MTKRNLHVANLHGCGCKEEKTRKIQLAFACVSRALLASLSVAVYSAAVFWLLLSSLPSENIYVFFTAGRLTFRIIFTMRYSINTVLSVSSLLKSMAKADDKGQCPTD